MEKKSNSNIKVLYLDSIKWNPKKCNSRSSLSSNPVVLTFLTPMLISGDGPGGDNPPPEQWNATAPGKFEILCSQRSKSAITCLPELYNVPMDLPREKRLNSRLHYTEIHKFDKNFGWEKRKHVVDKILKELGEMAFNWENWSRIATCKTVKIAVWSGIALYNF